jgi:hypothetical protein
VVPERTVRLVGEGEAATPRTRQSICNFDLRSVIEVTEVAPDGKQLLQACEI